MRLSCFAAALAILGWAAFFVVALKGGLDPLPGPPSSSLIRPL
jgi:hypothetical protein